MKRFKQYFPTSSSFLFCCLFLFGCINVTNKNPDEATFKDMKIKELYSISLPDYLTPSKTILNDEASLQYSNLDREFYVMVIDENSRNMTLDSAKVTFDEYVSNCTANISGGLMSVLASPAEKVSLNGLKGYKTTITGTYNKMNMVYKCLILQSPSHYYQVYCWTVKELLPRNEKDMNATLESFKELVQISI
ncbi:MAG: hypothetical protein WCL14_05860 [Bacteroidota bacterium]